MSWIMVVDRSIGLWFECTGGCGGKADAIPIVELGSNLREYIPGIGECFCPQRLCVCCQTRLDEDDRCTNIVCSIYDNINPLPDIVRP